jgi:hypothetical protein
MSQFRSVQTPQTHQSLIERLPQITGHDLAHWLARIEDGPGLLRVPERVNWLRDEYDLPHCYAAALVHESDRRRRAIRV